MERLTGEEVTRVFAIYGAFLAAGMQPQDAIVRATSEYVFMRYILQTGGGRGVASAVDGAMVKVGMDAQGDLLVVSTPDQGISDMLAAWQAKRGN